MKRKRCFLLLILILALACNPALAEEETLILLSETITVNGVEITQDAGSDVYLVHRTETHEDVPEELQDVENRVVTITNGGTYRIGGKVQDVQIRVEAGDEDSVRLILDGADISCRTAPAIAVISAADPRQPGQYGVTIELERGLSRINGSHTEKTEEDAPKLSGAITSLVSIGFEGEGFLDVTGDNEGIEVKNGHMTFNGGNILVTSGDDPLNASEDEVSVITLNDGHLDLQVKPDAGGEGDGMDSNGSIIINGGSVVSRAHPDSMDSGIDSDLGCIINGGSVTGAGNMYDEISAESAQLFMALQFAEKVGEKIVITTTDGEFVGVCEETGYSSYVLSPPKFAAGDYHLYLGGEITFENDELIYTPGVQLQHGGAFSGHMGRPELPEGFEPRKNMPEGSEFPKDMKPPQGDRNPGKKDPGRSFDRNMEPAEMSTTFHLAPGSTMFSGIIPVE